MKGTLKTPPSRTVAFSSPVNPIAAKSKRIFIDFLIFLFYLPKIILKLLTPK